MMAALAVAPSACAQELDRTLWQQYRQSFIGADGRVMDTGNEAVSHSEGQGFALLLALAANDRQTFESIFSWTEANLVRSDSGLYAWRYHPAHTPPVSDPNNATDGDVLISWALLMASVRWNITAYAERSQSLRAAILREVAATHAGKRLLLPGRIGFASDAGVVVNLSYYIWPALDAFARHEPMWNDIISDGLELLIRSQFGQWQLVPDWTLINTDGVVSPAPDKPARFGFDAVRVPLYLHWSGRTSELKTFRNYWRETEKATGWPAWIDVTTGETAPYPLSGGGQAIANMTIGRAMQDKAPSTDYYSESLKLLAKLGKSATPLKNANPRGA